MNKYIKIKVWQLLVLLLLMSTIISYAEDIGSLGVFGWFLFGFFLVLYSINKSIENKPMGVSQWEEIGKKYGYWDYFKKKK